MERKPQLTSREKRILFFYTLIVLGIIGLFIILNWLRLGVPIVQPSLHKAEIAVIVPLTGEGEINGKNIVENVTHTKNYLVNELGLTNWDITIHSYDSGKTADSAAWAAYLAAMNPNTIAIIGPLNARQIIASKTMVSGKNIAIITPGSTTPVLSVSSEEGVYRIPSPDNLQGQALVDLLEQKTYFNIYLLIESNDYVQKVLDSMMVNSAERIRLVGSVDVGNKDPDMDLIKSIKDSNADAIVYLGGTANLIPILQELNNKKVNIPIVGIDSINDPQIADHLSSKQDLFFTSPIYVNNKVSGAYLNILGSDTLKPFDAESVQATWLVLKALASNPDGLGRETVWKNLPYVSIRIDGWNLGFPDGQLSPSFIYIYKGGSSQSDWFMKPEYIFSVQ